MSSPSRACGSLPSVPPPPSSLWGELLLSSWHLLTSGHEASGGGMVFSVIEPPDQIWSYSSISELKDGHNHFQRGAVGIATVLTVTIIIVLIKVRGLCFLYHKSIYCSLTQLYLLFYISIINKHGQNRLNVVHHSWKTCNTIILWSHFLSQSLIRQMFGIFKVFFDTRATMSSSK